MSKSSKIAQWGKLGKPFKNQKKSNPAAKLKLVSNHDQTFSIGPLATTNIIFDVQLFYLIDSKINCLEQSLCSTKTFLKPIFSLAELVRLLLTCDQQLSSHSLPSDLQLSLAKQFPLPPYGWREVCSPPPSYSGRVWPP